MTKTFIIVAIIVVVITYLLYNQVCNKNEQFSSESVPSNGKNPQIKKKCDLIDDNFVDPSNKNTNNALVDGPYDYYDNNNSDNESNESNSRLVIGDSIALYGENTDDSDNKIRKKMSSCNRAKNEYKKHNYSSGKRGEVYDQAIDFIDQSNDLIQSDVKDNDQFMANDDSGGQYAAYKPEKEVDKYKTSELFNSKNFLPNDKCANPDWFDIVPDAINVKNRHLINVSKPMGINTVGTSLKNASRDIRGCPNNPKQIISIWNQSNIDPDTNFKGLC